MNLKHQQLIDFSTNDRFLHTIVMTVSIFDEKFSGVENV